MSFAINRCFLITALAAVSLAGCSAIHRRVNPDQPLQVIELGAAETRRESAPPETPALAHFLAGTLAMNGGDDKEATAQFEKAVAADPHSAMLRQRLAAIYVRAGKFFHRVHGIEPQQRHKLDLVAVLANKQFRASITRDVPGRNRRENFIAQKILVCLCVRRFRPAVPNPCDHNIKKGRF